MKEANFGDAASPLVERDKEKMVETCFAVYKELIRKKKDPRRRIKVGKCLLSLFNDDEEWKHRFALRVITSNVLGKGRIHAAHALGYYNVDAFIMADALFCKTDLRVCTKVVAEHKEAVREVIKFIAINFREPEKIVAEMRKKDVFQPYDFNFDPERWNPWRARRFIHFVCGDLEISKPVEARPLYVAVALGPCASAYGRAEMEADDFINICHELVGSNAGKQDWKEITDFFDDNARRWLPL